MYISRNDISLPHQKKISHPVLSSGLPTPEMLFPTRGAGWVSHAPAYGVVITGEGLTCISRRSSKVGATKRWLILLPVQDECARHPLDLLTSITADSRDELRWLPSRLPRLVVHRRPNRYPRSRQRPVSGLRRIQQVPRSGLH